MATMGKYCKAYPIERLREFSGWKEKAENFRQAQEGEDPPTHDFLYLQENYVVTDGIFKDEHVIFDDVTPEWVTYCQEALEFEIPDYARADKEEPATEEA